MHSLHTWDNSKEKKKFTSERMLHFQEMLLDFFIPEKKNPYAILNTNLKKITKDVNVTPKIMNWLEHKKISLYQYISQMLYSLLEESQSRKKNKWIFSKIQ